MGESEVLSLDNIFMKVRSQNISDVHLASNSPVMLRRFCRFQPAGSLVLSNQQLNAILEQGVPPDHYMQACKTGDVEYVHEIPDNGRYRVSVVRHRGGWGVTARVIDDRIRTVQESGMPPACEGLTKWAQGLVIITGPAGCGKTSTLASLIEMINQTREDHIITIEKPIEVVFTSKKSQVTQREIGAHTESSHYALRAALREDPDILVVNELRDLETFRLAITASETGHLVFATMNANDSAQALTSLIGSFPADEQPLIRGMIGESLRGVICQRLIPRKDGAGAAAAYEVMLMNVAVANMIKSNRTRQLSNVIMMGKKEGMLLLENSAKELVEKNIISDEDAKFFCPSSAFSIGSMSSASGQGV